MTSYLGDMLCARCLTRLTPTGHCVHCNEIYRPLADDDLFVKLARYEAALKLIANYCDGSHDISLASDIAAEALK